MRAVLVATWAAMTAEATPDEAAEVWEQIAALEDDAPRRHVRTRLVGGIR